MLLKCQSCMGDERQAQHQTVQLGHSIIFDLCRCLEQEKDAYTHHVVEASVSEAVSVREARVIVQHDRHAAPQPHPRRQQQHTLLRACAWMC